MRGLRHRHLRQLLTVTCCLIACSTLSRAQPSRTTTLDFATGSEFEDYLRVLQVAGLEPLHPWSIRGFSPRTISRFAAADSAGPWALRNNFRNGPVEPGSLGLGATFNSAYPYGTNDGGFPHLFVTTGDSWNLKFARIHSRVMWGKLYQSDYSPVTGSTHYQSLAEPGTVRLTASAQLVLVPSGMPGLELGLARFFHVPYRPGDPTTTFWKKPFKVFFLKNEVAQGD